MREILIAFLTFLILIFSLYSTCGNFPKEDLREIKTKKLKSNITEEFMNNAQSPYYSVEFSSTACGFEIRVNDMPAFRYNEKGMVSSEVPINHLILRSGKQKLSLQVFPVAPFNNLNRHSKVRISVSFYDAASGNFNETEVFAFETPEVPEGGIPEVGKEFFFEAKIPYQMDGWINSVDLSKQKAIKEELLKYFREVHSILSVKDFNSFRRIYDTKLIEVDKSIYSTPEETEDDWLELVEFISPEDMEVDPLPVDCQVVLYGKGKVATLLDSEHDPIIKFKSKDGKTEYQVPLLLHKPLRGEKFEVIR